MDSSSDLLTENIKLKAALEGLNRLFIEKFEAVQLSEEAQKALEERAGRENLIVELRLEIDKLSAHEEDLKSMIENLNGRILEMQEKLDGTNAARQRAENESFQYLSRLEGALKELDEKEDRIYITGKYLDHAKERLKSVQEEIGELKRNAQNTLIIRLNSAEEECANAKDDAAKAKAEVLRLSNEVTVLQEEVERLRIIDENEAFAPQNMLDPFFCPCEVDYWPELMKGISGVAKLRSLLLPYRKKGKVGLDTSEIRRLLKTCRHIYIDRALRDFHVNDSNREVFPFAGFALKPLFGKLRSSNASFAEYVYFWFRSLPRPASDELSRRVATDTECGRFLDDLERFQDKSSELRMFYLFLQKQEADEVSFYAHARLELTGLSPSDQITTEMSKEVAAAACKRIIMPNLNNSSSHAFRERFIRGLISTRDASASTIDLSLVLSRLIIMYREEKAQTYDMMKTLHEMADVQTVTPLDKVRALLKLVDPLISDSQVFDIYVKAGWGSEGIKFERLWIVLERSGFFLFRQQDTTDFKHDSLQQAIPAILSTWRSVQTNVQKYLHQMAASKYECDRSWAGKFGAELSIFESFACHPDHSALHKLRKLILSVLSWQYLRDEKNFKSTHPKLVEEELGTFASLLRKRIPPVQESSVVLLPQYHFKVSDASVRPEKSSRISNFSRLKPSTSRPTSAMM